MTVLEFVARTFSSQLSDGRFIFRPWGASGPCFLLSAQQRAVRAWIQLAFYGLALASLWLPPLVTVTTANLVAFAVAFVLFNYVLFWLFCIGLPETEKPLPPTLAQRRTAMAAHSRSVGRPVLWIFLIICCLFVFAGGVCALFLDEWLIGLLCVVFFGACGATFTWQLLLVAGRRDT